MNKYIFLFSIVVWFLTGCGRDPTPGANEVVKPPDEIVTGTDAPRGNLVADIGEQAQFSATGGKSSKGHPLEFRFDFDADGDHLFGNWNATPIDSNSWVELGTFSVKVQTRCQRHPNVMSDWSEAWPVMVGLGPETEIVDVVNIYRIGRKDYTETIDFRDAIPDTVPYGSWITVYYKGIDTTASAAHCPDPLNKCLKFQVRYERESARVAGSSAMSVWLPDPPTDTDPYGTIDSTSMNIGSVEYTINARAIDVFDREDPSPAAIAIVGNFDPTLDDYAIKNHDGEVSVDGETLVWDWWSPFDSSFVVEGTEVKKRKTFFFVVEASGHDHPKERQGSGILSWLYRFERVDEPEVFDRLGRSETWVEGTTVNVLGDTVWFHADYSNDDTNGDAIFDNLPDWINRWFNFTVMGKDILSGAEFEQYIYFGGGKQLINQYQAEEYGRWTLTGNTRFRLELIR